jgi:hypothetical protein
VGPAALVLRSAAVWRPLDVGDIATGLARAQLAATVLAVTLSLADLFDFTKRRRGIESGHLAHQSVDVVEAVGGGTGSGELLACLADSEADRERSRLGAQSGDAVHLRRHLSAHAHRAERTVARECVAIGSPAGHVARIWETTPLLLTEAGGLTEGQGGCGPVGSWRTKASWRLDETVDAE